MANPDAESVNSQGFDRFIGKTGSKKASDLGVTGKWPSAEQVADVLKKTGMGTGSSDVTRGPLQFLDPAYFDPLLFFIQHRDRKELNFRLRHAYEYEPVVGNLIDLHRQMPLSEYNLVCRDKSVERSFQEFSERIELLPTSSYMLGDWLLLGEAVAWTVWDDFNKTWKEITLIPPEKVEFRRTYLSKEPLMFLHVDSELKRLVNSADEIDKAIVREMDPNLVAKLRSSDRVFLPPNQAHHFANKISMSDLRGTSILKRALYAMQLKYKLRLLHHTYIDRAAFPLKVFKLGDSASKWIPSRAHFESLRNMLAQAQSDPDFSLLFHYGLQVEFHGAKDRWENLLPHYEWCDKEIMTALFANDALLHASGSTYSNANVSVRVLMSRYQTIRALLELFWKNKIFKPMALAREYWVNDTTGNTGDLPTRRHNGKFQYLDIPRFKWAKLNLLDDTTQKQFLLRLREKGEIPHSTIADIFGLDEEQLKDQLKTEEGSVVDPVWIETRKKAAAQPTVMSQILQGVKSNKWILDESTPEDEAKKKKSKERMDAKPDASKPIDAIVPPGEIMQPGGARTSPSVLGPSPTSRPPESPPTTSGEGVTSPVI